MLLFWWQFGGTRPSLRTPSYVLLAGFLYWAAKYAIFCYIQASRVTCTAGLLTQIVTQFFLFLTAVVIATTAVERWLYMSRRSLLTVCRVVILYIIFMLVIITLVSVRAYAWGYSISDTTYALRLVSLLASTVVFVVTTFSYYKVYRVIPHHQIGVQANQNAMDILKYRKSIFTILYILALFVLSYVPGWCCLSALSILQDYSETLAAAFNACGAVVFLSSFFNPLLYCWRIKELRIVVKTILRSVIILHNLSI